MSDELPEALRPNATDRVVAVLRSVSGVFDAAMPGTGSMFAELLTSTIPNQRQDRLIAFVSDLADRFRALNLDFEKLARTATADDIELIEEGMQQSIRATRTERLKRIANLVTKGLSQDQLEALEATRLLRSLSQIDEAEVQLLTYINGVGDLILPWPPLAYGTLPIPEGATKIEVSGGWSERPTVPPELSRWKADQLALSLGRLAGYGLIDAHPLVVRGDQGPARTLSANPAGRRLLMD